jgi:hypothetical protein
MVHRRPRRYHRCIMSEPDETATRRPKTTLAPWDNSGLRDRLSGAGVDGEAVELELSRMVRERDGEPSPTDPEDEAHRSG